LKATIAASSISFLVSAAVSCARPEPEPFVAAPFSSGMTLRGFFRGRLSVVVWFIVGI
jgi:hypothetical protein